MNVALPKDTFDRLILYLSKCPFGEVENLVNELRAAVISVALTPPVINPPVQPQAEGGDVSDVQSSETNTTQQTPPEQTVGEEANN